VALMYAFSSLQIGSIAGREAKQFYSQNLHVVLAISSFGMVFLSLLKASVLVSVRWAIWESSLILDISNRQMRSAMTQLITKLPESLVTTPGPIRTGFETISPYIGSGLETMNSAVVALMNRLSSLLIESNSLGGSIWAALAMAVQKVMLCINVLSGFVDTSIGAYEGRLTVATWREDAFGVSRSLLTNTGVFLLVLLILFNLTAKSPLSKGKHEDDSSDDGVASVSEAALGPPALQESTSGSPDSARGQSVSRTRKMTRSLSPRFDTIHEADEDDDAFVDCTEPPTTGVRSYQEPSPTEKKKKRGMSLRMFQGGRKSAGRATSPRASLSM
jgi:hypothetical protein